MAHHWIMNNRDSEMSRMDMEQPAKGKVRTYMGAISRPTRKDRKANKNHATAKTQPWQPLAELLSLSTLSGGGQSSASLSTEIYPGLQRFLTVLEKVRKLLDFIGPRRIILAYPFWGLLWGPWDTDDVDIDVAVVVVVVVVANYRWCRMCQSAGGRQQPSEGLVGYQPIEGLHNDHSITSDNPLWWHVFSLCLFAVLFWDLRHQNHENILLLCLLSFYSVVFVSFWGMQTLLQGLDVLYVFSTRNTI